VQVMRRVSFGVIATCIAFLLLYHLRDYPTTWFDEGSHLHVPKTLLRLGVYADYSSDGFRHYGPTLGVGPTVLLPIAAMFSMFGVGLLQARLVMVLYLAGALYLFYRLARKLDVAAVAGLALALLVSSPALAIFETGRQVLGEVPALCFLLAGLLLWFSGWGGSPLRLAGAGLLLGAAAITKYQFFLVLVPTIILAALANQLYYRTAKLRVFVCPWLVMVLLFALWQAILVVYLGPETAAQNLTALRQATAGAAAVFSPTLMRRALGQILGLRAFGGSLALALVYGVFVSMARAREAQRWNVLLLFSIVNLVWFVFASIGWPRYAFGGLAIASIFVAKFFADLIRLARTRLVRSTNGDAEAAALTTGMLATAIAWPVLVIVPALAWTIRPILRPPANSPIAMAALMNETVPPSAVVETWEPELGFLTNHTYHYPPSGLLNIAVRHIWSGGPAPRTLYDPFETEPPRYVVLGAFAKWVDVYSTQRLEHDYRRIASIGGYDLYCRNDAAQTRHNGN
jgi:4-amino-4-deoxy-L-arabinose transferase-like glycosyltransferase